MGSCAACKIEKKRVFETQRKIAQSQKIISPTRQRNPPNELVLPCVQMRHTTRQPSKGTELFSAFLCLLRCMSEDEGLELGRFAK